MGLRVDVPGKLVLLGEYAVLDGAPALVAAVDRGVSCEAEQGEPLRIETPGSDDHFVRPALEAAGATGRFRFTAWNPPIGVTEKVGLGSSGAACVAALRAWQRLVGGSGAPEVVFGPARRVHHQVQGSGSGIDVAASSYGGVLRYRPDAPEPVAVPELHLAVIWSGASAKTGPRVQRYRAWPDRTTFARESGSLVEAFPADPIPVLRQARRLLEHMANQAGIAYRTPALDRIADLAEAHGGAAKPSGAGGGDIAVGVFPDPRSRAAFVDACAAQGLPEVRVELAPAWTPPSRTE